MGRKSGKKVGARDKKNDNDKKKRRERERERETKQ